MNNEALIEQLRMLSVLEAKLEDDELNRIELNAKQWLFANCEEREAYLSGPNQIGGKTTALNYIARCQATGLYPPEWTGPRFKDAPYIIILSVTNAKVQETMTDRLFGPFVARGTGYLPSDTFDPKVDLVALPGGAKGQLKEAYVKHVSGQKSKILFASYQHGWEALQGSTPQLILCDEEPHPWKVYDELSARLNKTRGFMRIAASPTHGATRVRKIFKRGKLSHRYIPYTIYDCDHIDEEHKQELLEKYEGNPMAEVRLFGEAAEGEGLIFPIDHDRVRCGPISISDSWQQIIGVDLSHTPSGVFAASKMVFDKTSDVLYWVSMRKASGMTKSEQAEIMRVMGGKFVPIAWPHDGNRLQDDGRALQRAFREDYGLNMLEEPAHRVGSDGNKSNSIGPVIQEVYDRMRTGRFKIVDTPDNAPIFDELEAYIAVNGKVKDGLDDHGIDSMLKAVMDLRHAISAWDSERLGNLRGQARERCRPRKRDFFTGSVR